MKTVFDRDHPLPQLKDLAYGIKHAPDPVRNPPYRLERGFPYFRGGKMVPAIPLFKALPLFSHSSDNAGGLGRTATPVKIQWPAVPK